MRNDEWTALVVTGNCVHLTRNDLVKRSELIFTR